MTNPNSIINQQKAMIFRMHKPSQISQSMLVAKEIYAISAGKNLLLCS